MTVEINQFEAAKRGEPVRISADEVQFVLLRADVYERLRDSLDPREGYSLINDVMRDDDELDPLLARYQ